MIAASALGIGLIATLWWLHFDTLAPAIEQAMHRTRDLSRIPLARDVFTYLHLLLITGIVSTALGLKLVVEEVAAPGVAPLPTRDAVALFGGVALFLLADVAAAARTFRRLRRSSLVAALGVCLLIVPATWTTPLSALAALLAARVALALFQRFTGTEARTRVKRSIRHEEQAAEEAISHWRRQHL